MRLNAEVTLVAYNGRSSKTAKAERLITGLVKKITPKYIWVLNAEDGRIWKAKV